jgi:hypothetical protein
MNFKKRKHIFVLTGGLLLIILTALLPLTISYSNSVGERHYSYYKDIKNFSKDISNYTVGVEGSLRIYKWGPNYEVTSNYYEIVGYFYQYYLDLTPFSSEGINKTGILFYTYERLLDGVSESNYSRTLDRASLIEEDGIINVLSLSTRFMIRGSIEIEYTSNATPFTEVIDFSLNIVHPEGSSEHNQALSLARSLSFWHIASFIIVPVLFAFINQRLKKQPQMTSEDEEFWRKVRERNKLLREKNGEE